MERRPNPYRPGFNRPPEVLAGRKNVLSAAEEALAEAAFDARSPRPLVIVGSRGVGKTVLLGEIAAMAGEIHGWPTAHVEVRPQTPFIPQLTAQLVAIQELLGETPPGKRFQLDTVAASVSVLGTGAAITLSRDREGLVDGQEGFERTLSATCEAALERGAGLVLALDELQLASRDEVSLLMATLQQHMPDNWPLVVVVAGLFTLRDPDRSVTYLERGEWHEIGLLNSEDTLVALSEPARNAGRPLNKDAANLLAEASGGYPYAVQVFGHHAWRCSRGQKRITSKHAADAIVAANRELADGFYAARWEDASPKEQEYLAALAKLSEGGSSVTGAEVASYMGATPKELSYLRDRLLKKGTLFATGQALQFPIPGFATWIRARNSDLPAPKKRPSLSNELAAMREAERY